MSAEEYWKGEPYLAYAYLEAEKLRQKRANTEMWMQGRYIFDAFTIVTSNIHLDGKNHEFNNYLEKPYDIFPKSEEVKQKEAEEKAKEKFKKLCQNLDMRFGKKKDGQNGY